MNNYTDAQFRTITSLCEEIKKNNNISNEDYARYRVKRGLRNADGSGVMAGLTMICNVHGYIIDDGERVPEPGKLFYRGIDVQDIVDNCVKENRFGFEEAVWLLIFGSLPTRADLERFSKVLGEVRELPTNFADDMITKAPSRNIMNKLARSVLALYSFDSDPDTITIDNVVRQSIRLVACLPTIMSHAYQVKRRAYDQKTMFVHPIDTSLTTAEHILYSIRADKKFTDREAKLLDLCLILHAEHGGGNNSTFTTRVLSSSGTDTYSAIAAAIGSLKGPRHGGANIKAAQMLSDIRAHVKDTDDDDEVEAYLEKIIRGEAGDGMGLIYGMGHAVYTLSDPRAVILRENAEKLARERGMIDEFNLIRAVERLTPTAYKNVKGVEKLLCANVDLYSGFVYKMLGISEDLFTPMFAVARVAGWCAHRLEEIGSGGKIIRPAYKSVVSARDYIPIDQR